MAEAKGRTTLRLNRFLARAGLGSRREVEELIRSGRVVLNGQVPDRLAVQVDPTRDRIELDGCPVRLPARWRVYAFHKPQGVVSTLKPRPGQVGLATFRQQSGLSDGVVPVGRLDAETTGLLIWTDDGELAQALCRPANRVWKCYEVLLNAPLSRQDARVIAEGRLQLDGRPCRSLRIRAQAGGGGRRWIMELHEGRKRQIRRMFALLGLKVSRLKRVAVGPIQLSRLKEGCFRRLSNEQERALRRAAGLE